jgi:hypothetical protein
MHKAIVLKRLSSAYKVALLDQEKGRVDGIVSKAPCVGALLEYRIEKERNSSLFINYYSIIDLPFAVAREDILFWHHILELCFYFVPPGYYVSSLFELLQFLYTVDSSRPWNVQSKKLYLFKLLAAIGLYDELPQLVPASRVDKLLALAPHQITQVILDEKSEQVVNKWLRTCVVEHPKIQEFHTVHFLVNMDSHE